MRVFVFLVAGLFAASVASAHQNESRLSLSTFGAQQDGDITNIIEQVETPDSVFAYDVCKVKQYYDRDWETSGDADRDDGDSSSGVVLIDKIINLGQKIWTIVQAGKPVLEANYTYANALPKGVKSSSDLDGFSAIHATTYRMHGVNLLGITVYDFTYSLVHRHSGSYNGKGQYLDNVTVLPQNISLLWGYTMNAKVAAVSVVNIATKDAPVAGLGMELEVKVSTVLKSTQFRGLYDFHGNSENVLAIQ